MNNLLEFLKKYNYWFVFIVLETISCVLLFRFNHYQGSVFFTSANELSGRVNGFYMEITSYMSLKEVNQSLSTRNVHLQRQVNQLREALKKATEETSKNDQLVLDSLQGYHLIAAKVASNSILKNENYIVIDKGEADGVKTEMGVVGGGGIVGIVFLTNRHYSLVLPTINVKSNVSCRIRHHRYFGYLQWAGGSTLYAYLNDIPRYAKIKVGEYVETSGYSSVFPPGLFVGKVTDVANAPDGLSLQLKVNLGTDFANLSDVYVIENEHRAEVDDLNEKLRHFEDTEE